MVEAGRAGAIAITGASSGIGEACALRLAALGHRVFAGARKSEDGERLRARGGDRIEPILMDVTDAGSLRAAAERVKESLGGAPLAGLVNNAGIVVGGPLEFVPIEELRRQLEVNAVGPVAAAQAFLPLLRAARGRIVNIGSVSGFMAFPLMGPYCASKFALRALNDALRMELRPWGISVSLVEPGSIQTPIWEKSRAAGEALAEGLAPEAGELYGKAIEGLKRTTEHVAGRAEPVELVVRAVERALLSRRPKARYLVGRSARMQAFAARFVPSRLLDGIIVKEMGIEG